MMPNSFRTSDIAISSRVRLARNLSEYPFPGHMSPSQEREVADSVSSFLCGIAAGTEFSYLNLQEMDDFSSGALVERHIISPELSSKKGSRGVVLSSDEKVGIMLNEEDHIRLQVLGDGLCLGKCYERANQIDDLIDSHFSYAWSENLGYLTHCPTNLGTGMRASVMLHLPSHAHLGEIHPLIANLGKLGFAIRGIYGEGSRASGSLYQISNQITLGPTEGESLERLGKVALSCIEREQELRSRFLRDNAIFLEDLVWRAYGILAYARRIHGEEAMELISRLRVGVSCGIVKDISSAQLNELSWAIQPNNLSKSAARALAPQERDLLRARLIKERLFNNKKEA